MNREWKLHERWCATGTEMVVERGNYSRLHLWQQEKQRGNESNQDRRHGRSVHLPMQEHGDGAIMVRGIRVRMNQFVKPVRRGEQQQRKEERETDDRPDAASRLVPKRQYGNRLSHCGSKYMTPAQERGKRFLAP